MSSASYKKVHSNKKHCSSDGGRDAVLYHCSFHNPLVLLIFLTTLYNSFSQDLKNLSSMCVIVSYSCCNK